MALSNSTCIENGSDFTLGGFWDESTVKLFVVSVIPCDNNTSPVTCHGPEEINNFFKGKYLNVNYASNIIDVNNYEKPFQKIYQTTYSSVDQTLSKEMRLFFKKTELKNDIPKYRNETNFCFCSKRR